VLHTYRQLIALRKNLPVLTFGDYQDLDPDSPACWCYQRQDEEQTLRVIANLSGEPLALSEVCLPDEAGWRLLYGNYADGAQLPATGTLRPYECGWWLRE
jgi:trehalose-6-phosphate hydrolase